MTRFSDYIEKNYGSVIHKYEEQHKKDQKEIQIYKELHQLYQKQRKNYQKLDQQYQKLQKIDLEDFEKTIEKILKIDEEIQKYENLLKEIRATEDLI